MKTALQKMKAILAIDSFKGCLTSEQAESAASKAFPEGETISIPVSDGGEGFSSIVTRILGGEMKQARCSDPLGRSVVASYGLVGRGRVAVIDTASASGLGLLSRNELNPLAATSYGTGELVADALDEGVDEIWLGLGGTATCDGGTGMLQALGYKFMTSGGILPEGHTVLGNIIGIDSSHRHKALSRCRVTGFYDVSVPFHGTGGAARMFAPQKGAGPEMVEALDNWMAQLCTVYSRFSGREIRQIPGSGAAGGIGGAMRACLGASMNPGIWHVLDIAGMGHALDTCDLVITGEGSADAQTIRGKVPYGVLEYVRKYDSECGDERKTKVVLAAGQVRDMEILETAGFDAVIQTTPEDSTLQEALVPETAMENITSALKGFSE